LPSLIVDVTYRDADTVDAKIAQAKNAGTVRDNTNLRRRVGPVPEHGPNGLPLLDGDIESLRAGVYRRILQADVANGRSVDERHQLPGVVDEQAVEEVDTVVLES